MKTMRIFFVAVACGAGVLSFGAFAEAKDKTITQCHEGKRGETCRKWTTGAEQFLPPPSKSAKWVVPWPPASTEVGAFTARKGYISSTLERCLGFAPSVSKMRIPGTFDFLDGRTLEAEASGSLDVSKALEKILGSQGFIPSGVAVKAAGGGSITSTVDLSYSNLQISRLGFISRALSDHPKHDLAQVMDCIGEVSSSDTQITYGVLTGRPTLTVTTDEAHASFSPFIGDAENNAKGKLSFDDDGKKFDYTLEKGEVVLGVLVGGPEYLDLNLKKLKRSLERTVARNRKAKDPNLCFGPDATFSQCDAFMAFANELRKKRVAQSSPIVAAQRIVFDGDPTCFTSYAKLGSTCSGTNDQLLQGFGIDNGAYGGCANLHRTTDASQKVDEKCHVQHRGLWQYRDKVNDVIATRKKYPCSLFFKTWTDTRAYTSRLRSFCGMRPTIEEGKR